MLLKTYVAHQGPGHHQTSGGVDRMDAVNQSSEVMDILRRMWEVQGFDRIYERDAYGGVYLLSVQLPGLFPVLFGGNALVFSKLSDEITEIVKANGGRDLRNRRLRFRQHLGRPFDAVLV